MCGILGFLSFNETGKSLSSGFNVALETLAKRGPDHQGVFQKGNLFLGHRRLSIIDTSSAGNQPFTDESGNFTIIFNGEIFNYKELRKELISKGHTFKTQTDTEVVLKLFIEYGKSFLDKLSGFFSLAIFNEKEDKLFIARDQYGIKPLCYYLDENCFIFSSENKALNKFSLKREIDRTSLFLYFKMNYLPGKNGMLKNHFRLEPGCLMEISDVNNHPKISEERYYELKTSQDSSLLFSRYEYEKAKKHLAVLMESSVEKRLISDVPLGSFLSGGIDSSIVTAIAAKHVTKLDTFSVGFKDSPFFDETYFANLLAKKHNTNHTVFSLSNDDLFAHLDDILEYIDEPFADSSAIAVYILSKETKSKVTVALSGDGADEVFAGYNKHAAEYKITHHGMQANIAKALHPLLKQIPKSRSSKTGNIIRQMSKFAHGASLNARDRYLEWAGIQSDEQVSYLLKGSITVSAQRLSDEAHAVKKAKDHLSKNITAGEMNSVLLSDMNMVLPYDMLTKVDMMSMANSLEVRPPFLDKELVDFTFTLPSEFKITANSRKRILKDTFADLLPNEILHREKKGFEVPLLKWFRGELYLKINTIWLSDELIERQGIFNLKTIQQLKKQLLSKNPEDVQAVIWALIVFQSWWLKYMDK